MRHRENVLPDRAAALAFQIESRHQLFSTLKARIGSVLRTVLFVARSTIATAPGLRPFGSKRPISCKACSTPGILLAFVGPSAGQLNILKSPALSAAMPRW